MKSSIVIHRTKDGIITVKDAPEETTIGLMVIGEIYLGLIAYMHIEDRKLSITATNGVFWYELLDVDRENSTVNARKI